MSGSTQGERKLSRPAVNEIAMPNEALSSMPAPQAPDTGRPASDVGRGGESLGRRALRWYYALKYAPFRGERQGGDGRRGAVVLQIDALAYADLRRAIEAGYCPTIAHLLRHEGFELRRWFCGLPSATPYCQAGIFHGENA